MTFQITLWQILLFAGTFQGIFLSLVLLTSPKGNVVANRFLAGLIFIVTFKILVYLITNIGLYEQIPHIAGLSIPSLFLIGPFYYFFAVSILRGSFPMSIREVIHLFPFICYFLYYADFYFLDGESKVNFIKASLDARYYEFQTNDLLFISFLIMHMMIYTYVAWTYLNRYQNNLEQTSSDSNVVKVIWFKKISFIFIGYLGIYLGFFLMLVFFNSYTKTIDEITALVQTLNIHILGYLAISKGEIFSEGILSSSSGKYSTSGLNEIKIKEHLNSLLTHMELEKPYLKSDLKIDDLASQMNMATHHLSQVINQEIGTNFFNFINRYRVEEAKKMLVDKTYAHYTVLGIGLEAGFSNKASFNRVFKKYTQKTPSEYLANKLSDC